MNTNKYANFSKFIDPKFNFDNKVPQSKVALVDEMMNLSCNGNIMLEPRLQEYLRKKRFSKLNNITPCVTLEQEFLITKYDKKMLKAFLKGKRDIYDNPAFDPLKQEKTSKMKRIYFPSKYFRDDDPRVQEIEPQSRNKPKNMGMFAPDDDEEIYYKDETNYRTDIREIMDARDFKNIEEQNPYDGSGFDLNYVKFQPRNDPKMYKGVEKHDRHTSQYRIDPDPRNKYIITDLLKKGKLMKNAIANNYSPFTNMLDEEQKETQEILSEMNGEEANKVASTNYKSYAQEIVPGYSMKSEIDPDLKMSIPNTSSNNKRNLNSSDYIFDFGSKRLTDAELESTLIRGMPARTKKSFGFRNPFENQYDYIEADFNARAVEPWERSGLSTRLDNKQLAKNIKYREVM